MDQKRRRSIAANKFRTFRVSIDPPVPLDLSKEITRLFDVNVMRKQRISEYMCESIRATKQKAFKASIKEVQLPLKTASAHEIREYAKKCPSTPMSRFQERDIKNKINGRGLEEKYPQLLKTIMDETKEIYLRITHFAGMNMKVKPSVDEERFIIKPFKYLGKTENYQNYLAVKQQLSLKWILHKPIIQKLLTECVTNLPYEILNLNFHSVLKIDEFKTILDNKIQQGRQSILDFYVRILNLIEQYNIGDNYYLGACTGLLSVHLSRTMAHTLLHIVEFTTNKDMKPYLILEVTFKENLVVTPTAENVIEIFQNIFENICDIITELKSLENPNKHLYLCLTEEFISSCLEEIKNNIRKEFEPIVRYLEDLSKNISIIYNDVCSENLLKSLADMEFKTGCSKMKYYKQYTEKVQHIPNKEYFPGGEIDLILYRETLYNGLKHITNTIFNKLCSQHYWETNDICESFQLIHMRALKETETTEELIETGKFMAFVKDEHLQALTERVHASVELLSKIILLGLLRKDHMKTNSKAVNWLDIIPPVIEHHSAVYEQLKFEAEEKLQKIIEDVNVAIKEVFPLLVMLDDMDNIFNVKSYLNNIITYMKKIKNIEEQIAWINQEEVCLSFPKSVYSEYENLKNYVYPFYHLLKVCLDIQRNLSVWQDGQFDKLNYETTNSLVNKYYKELIETQKDYRKKLRQAQDDNLPVRFRGTVDDPDILNWPAPLKLCVRAIQMIEEFKPSIRVMKIMCNNSLRKRHWVAMSEIASFDMTPNAGTTLRKIMKYDLQANLDKYEIISNGALKEKLLLESLQGLKLEWENILFISKQVNGNYILIKLNDILEIIDEHIIKILNMKSSVFVQPYEKEVNNFYEKILKIKHFIDMWEIFQSQWLKLYPIFSIESIANFLGKEYNLFQATDATFKSYINHIRKKELAMDVVCETNISTDVKSSLDNFEVINKGVIIYLDNLRNYFPRFYFLPNENLIQIVSNSNKPTNIQDYIRKLFRSINQLKINEENHIVGMISQEQELVNFTKIVDIAESQGCLEKWLLSTEKQMIDTLRSMLIECRKYCRKDTFMELFNRWPQQILEIHTQVLYTEAIDNALAASGKIRLRLYLKKIENAIAEKIEIINNKDISNFERHKIKSLTITDINNKAIAKNLLEKNITAVDDFNWEIQLKYYQQSEKCFIRTLKCTINYLFEYQGNLNQIIITPLTDRCFRSLINSNCLHLNALIKGSAETGKTETVKSLSKAFAILIITFNCSECLNYQTIQRFLKGAAICGAWLCVKKINLVQSEILSIIYQDISTIVTSIKSKLHNATLEGNLINVNESCFVCMTIDINKSTRNFPENFKLLFRCITMTTPDLKIITEVGLYSLGFLQAPKLSKKINMSFKILKDFIFSGKSLKFGLEYIKLLLKGCEVFKQKYPQIDEGVIVRNSIKEVIYTRLLKTEVDIFDNILTNIFPNNTTLVNDNSYLNEAISQACKQFKLIPNDLLFSKTTELYDYIKRKHGIIVIGDTASGKTTILKVCTNLIATINNTEVIHNIVNPNSLQYHQLFGIFDPTSDKWYDGVVTNILRKSAQNKNPHFIQFDGNIDSTWIENINNVLEGDKTYYLSSGETITLHEKQAIIFEVKDLKSASPATISHCGVVYVDSSTVNWKYIIDSWILNYKSESLQNYSEYLKELLIWILTASLDFLKQHCVQLCYPGDLNQVNTMLLLTEMFLNEALSQDEDLKNVLSWIQASLLQSGVWGVAGILDLTSRYKFDEFYKLLWRGQNKDHPYPKCLEKLDVSIPQEGIIFDYTYIYKQRGNWKLWIDILKTQKINESEYMINFLVPTIETIRYTSIINLHIKYNHNVLLIGPSGTGKTIMMEDILVNKVEGDIYDISRIAFSINLTANQIQKIILSKLNKRKSGFYTPPESKKTLIFLEDVNIAKKTENGTICIIELLRQQFDHNIWYDLNNHNEIFLKDVNFIAKINIPGGYRQALCSRFLRHFCVYSINNFSCDTITKIYSTILQYSLKQYGFPSDTMTMVTHLTQTTLYIYQQVKKHFQPNINQSHYIFDLRDFSRVIRSCLILKRETYDSNKKIYIKLWTHEILRTFGDRLNASEDEQWLFDNIKHCFKTYFFEDINEICENLPTFDEEITKDSLTKLLFGFFGEKDNQVNGKYEEVTNLSNLNDSVNLYLAEYNKSNKLKLDVTIFEDSLIRLSKLCRILKTNPGNALLIGVSGSGRESLTKLSSFINSIKITQPNITANYTLDEWNEEIKTLLRESGGNGNQIVFLVGEHDILEEAFLDSINYIFKGSEIPTLYNANEKQEILELVRLSAQHGNRNVDISSSSVFLFFHKRCLLNLHIVLCLSSIGTKITHRLSMYPYLTNSNVIWWNDWPDQYFENIAQIYFQDVDIADNIKNNLPKICLYFHRDIQYIAQSSLKYNRKIYITTSHYSHMIKLFVELIKKKQTSLLDTKKRYTLGLNKLSYAANQILDMQKSLAEYQPQLEEMTQKAIEMTKQIALETIEVEKASALVRTDEKVAHRQAEVAQVLKMECEAELAQAIPILEDAISALNTLKPSDITLVKSMKNPPDAIKLVMAAVCVIKDVRPDRIPDPSTGRKTLDYWGPSKRILGDMNFLQTLKDFDKDNIKPEIMVKIRKDYLPHKDFKPHVVAKASSAAEGLCKWIIAMDMYDKVAKEVAPKKEKLEKAEREYAETMRILNEKKEEVARIEGKLASLNELLCEARRKQQKLQVEVDICKEKLRKAQKLIGGLSGEKVRWTEISEKLQNHFDFLTGDILLSSAFISYLSGFVKHERCKIVNNWFFYITKNNIPITERFCFQEIIGSDVEIGKALSLGLPNDTIFIENALILENTKFYSLFIDPQYTAKNWIQMKEKSNNCIITKFSENYLEKIVDCIQFGRPIIIQHVGENIPLNLMPFLKKQIIIDNEKIFYCINERLIKFHKNFRFYMFTNKQNPHYLPEIWNQITVLNFHITKVALTNILLNIVVEIEKPEFKKVKIDLSRQMRKNKAEIKQLEEKILFTLTESETDILEDETSIQILHESKDLAKTIREKQEESKELELPIIQFQKDYMEVANHACYIYYGINDLHYVHYTYQFSMEWYIDVYFNSILKSNISKKIDERRANLKSTFTYSLYLNTAEALYNRHKLLLAFLITCKILLGKNQITTDEYLYFICGKCEIDLQEENPVSCELSDSKWNNICHLEMLPIFNNFKNDFSVNIMFWGDFLNSDDPFTSRIPEEWDKKINSFHKLILINLLRPDKLYSCIPTFIERELGKRFIEPLEFDINEVYNKSYSLQPIIFLLTPGDHPLNSLSKLVTQKKYTNKFHTLSLGSKDNETASNLIEVGKTQGSWLFLQNCHYAKDWLLTAQSKIENMDYQNTHENFRLWLSIKPYPEIPETLLQNSIKIINEPPQILRQKLIKLYKEEPITDESFYRGCPGKHATFARLLYGLAFFHSNIQERQKMYSMDTPYLFSDKDFLVSLQQLQSIINETNFTFHKLIYIIGTCNYGGYIGSNYGKQLLNVLLEECLNEDIVKNHMFAFNNVVNYGLPNKNDHQDYMHYIEKLPASDMPEIFGLHPNSDVGKGLQYRNEFLTSLFNASRLNQRNTIDENETLIFCMVSDILNSLPNFLDLENLSMDENDSRYFVICKEIKLYNKIIRTVKCNLNGIRDVLEGYLTINSDLNDVMDKLLNNQIPHAWLNKTKDVYDNNLTIFIDSLIKNIDYFETLIKNNGNIEEHKLSAYFSPKGILCSLKINYSRKYNLPLENIILDYKVLKTENLQDCFKTSSLYLVNASWNLELNMLEENTSKQLYTFMPPIIFQPTHEENKFEEQKFKCQIYNRDVRRASIFEKDNNYIISVLLNTNNNHSHWMKRGVVLYCEVDM